jgi:CHAT domain-containing protein
VPLDCTADYVVSSYITTLNSLKALHQQWAPLAIAELSACIVAAPEVEGRPFLPAVSKEAFIVSSYFSAEKQAVVSEVPSTLAALSTSHILHFAGHGEWSGHNPLEGELQLADQVLPLEELMQPRPTPSILAFLDACSTTRRNGPSCALDLLLCGFRSVVMSVG